VSGGYSGGDLHTVAVLNEWSVDHDVELILSRGSSPEIASLLTPKVKVHGQFGSSRYKSRLAYLMRVVVRTLATSWYVAKRRTDWDVVIGSTHFLFDAIPVLLTRPSRGRGIYWWHHLAAVGGRPAWTEAVIRASEMLLAQLLIGGRIRVLAGNSSTRKWLESRGVDPSIVTLTSNGPSFEVSPGTDDDPSVMQTLRDFEGRKFVLFCARLYRLKGAGDLPTIAKYVVGADRETMFAICGPDSAESPAIRRSLRDLEEAGSVAFLGFVSEAAKKWLFTRAHVLIAPSYEEGWGLTVSDGILSGCWVVAYDLPAVREACPEGPIFIPLGDATAFSEAITECLKLPRRAPVTVSGHLWRTVADDDLIAVLGPRESVR
jgi:glycosyltransferase involved in cell wall biosynthesis